MRRRPERPNGWRSDEWALSSNGGGARVAEAIDAALNDLWHGPMPKALIYHPLKPHKQVGVAPLL